MSARILIIDDSPTVREKISSLLAEEGYEVFAEGNAAKAIESIKEIRPDLVILDIMMPEMDGYTLLRHIRKEKAFAALPVLMLSAKEEEGMKDLFSLEGISGYMQKPFQDEDLIDLIDKTLE
ncbi:MAG: response regulator [Candidatus Omnitrophica bacterium]|nr:response regulator [Candidatus Omnitrophota bacterium]